MNHPPGFLKLVSSARRKIKEMTISVLRRKLRSAEPPVLIDIREEHEWDDSHASGAIHLGKGIIERDIEKTIPDKQTEIVLYCGGGFRSALSAANLRQMGYKNVYSLKGGWRAWKRSKGPIER
jgi:rhodanese-related sulfurtransferase